MTRFFSLAGAWFFVAVSAFAAPPICGTLTPLIQDSERGFVALRGAPEEQPKYWVAKPFLDHAKCDVWMSDKNVAHNVRCVANDQFEAAKVTAFYQATVKDIDACLAGLKEGPKFNKVIEPVSMPLLRGQITDWVLDTDTSRIKIEITDYLRTKTNSSYNSLSVEFLKY